MMLVYFANLTKKFFIVFLMVGLISILYKKAPYKIKESAFLDYFEVVTYLR